MGPQLNSRRAYPEKLEERRARQLMEVALGFTGWHLSQSRATRQTPGWPDMLFTHAELGLAVYYEAKAPGGKQSPAQQEFQRQIVSCGHEYVVGTADAMTEWAVSKGLVRMTAGGGLVLLRPKPKASIRGSETE